MKSLIMLAAFVLLLATTAFAQRAVIPAHGPYTYTAPTISPDGKYLAFLRMQENEQWTRPAVAVGFIRIKDLGGTYPFNGATEELYGSATMKPQRIISWVRNPEGEAGVAYFVRENTNEVPERLLVQQIADGVPSRFVMPDYSYFRNVAFAPTMEQVVAVVPIEPTEDRLILWQPEKQATVAECASFAGATWTPDESALIFSASGLREGDKVVNGTYQLFRYEVATGKLTKITQGDNTTEMVPVLMPDKQHLLFLAGNDQLGTLGMAARNGINKWMSKYNVSITLLANYAPRTITTGMRPVVSPDGKKLFVYQYRDADPKEHLFGNCVGVITDLTGKELKTIDFGREEQYTGDGFTFAADSNHFIYARNGSLWLDAIGEDVAAVQ
ncbi:MAG: TolB family protein [Armatimonadota bacterium]